ncbi:MAG TPA: hypothetical protein VI685_12415 [Candidatus Angelobacter sp.]
MAFDDPRGDDQDETTTFLPRFGGLNYVGANDPDQQDDSSAGQRLSIGQRIVQMARKGIWQPQSTLQPAPELMPDQGGVDSHVRRIFPSRVNEAVPNAGGLSVGQTIPRLGPETIAPWRESGLTPVSQAPAQKWGFEQPQGRNIFRGFIPAGADPSMNVGSRGYEQSNPFLGMGKGSTFDQAEKSGSPPIVSVSGQQDTRSKIPKQSSVPLPNPPKLRPDKTQLQQQLSQLMTGIRGPAMTPMGVAPDGAPMLDMTSQVRSPSKIFPEKNRGGFVYGDKVKPEILTKVKGISDRLGIDPNWLMTAIDFETNGKWSPNTPNAMHSGATGLIQFMPEIAEGLGTSTEKLGKMSQQDQLDYVEKYLQPHKGQMHSLTDVYMAILHPADLRKPDDYVLFRSPSKAYRQNSSAFDADGKGYVTKADVARALNDRYREALVRGTIVLNTDGTVTRVGGKHITRPPKPAKVRANRTQLQRALSELMAGLRGPAMTPMGVAPDGAPMLDITSQIKAPSKIFPEKNRESKSRRGLGLRPAQSQK